MSDQLGTVDGWLEALYQRLGWRTVIAYGVFSWAAAGALALIAIPVYTRVVGAPSGANLDVAAWIAGTWLVGVAISMLLMVRRVRPIASWLSGGRDPAGADDAWREVVALPWYAVRVNAAVAVVIAPPGVLLAIHAAEPLSLEDAIAVMFCLAVVLFGGTAAALFTAQLAMRPLARDVAKRLGEPPPLDGDISLRTKLLVAVPSFLALGALVAVFVTLPPGNDLGDTLDELVLGVVAALVVAAPIVLLLTYSTMEPLDDLLRATQRLQRGDFSTRVPELSGDEYAELARSFNEAMQSLERFAAENDGLLEDLRASRARIVAASDAERRRVERNLHDGAQQQLVALSLELSVLEDGAGDEATKDRARQAKEKLGTALADLRELARGLHPQVLSTGGLKPALEQLAERSPVPVSVEAPQERFSDAVESTAYFVASEALANVAKYAKANRAEISAERSNGRLTVTITDDGVGGADPNTGSGLSGLADRVAALNGVLMVDSSAGGGTTVTVELKQVEPIRGVGDG